MDLSTIDQFQDAVITVMGLGRYKQGSGLGAAKWLIRHGAQVIITDLKDESELEESMDLVMQWYREYRQSNPDQTIYAPLFVLGEHREEDFTQVDCVVQNPGVPSNAAFVQAAQQAGVPIESDVSLFLRFCPYPVIAVTGTKGKTTTTKLIGAMCEQQDKQTIVAGNIKTSPLDYLDDLMTRKQEIFIVLEFSSWMLESVPAAFNALGKGPDIAVLTNIYPDHLKRYASYEDYIHSKELLFLSQTPEQYTVLNYDHEVVRQMQSRVKGKLFWCSRTYQEHNGCYIKDGMIVFHKDGKDEEIIALQKAGLQGVHNIENILTSACAARLRGIDRQTIASTIETFKGVSDRQELVREVDEITYINDTTATQPDSVAAALKRFGADSDILLIAGGADRGANYDELVKEIQKTCKHVVLFEGEASNILEKKLGSSVKMTSKIKTMKDAVLRAKSFAASGDIILLSPGAPGAPLFTNEFDRGEQFREEVRNL